MSLKVVLGYSGGLDTSVVVPWLRENYDAEVICVAAGVGQPGGLEGLEEKAKATGASRFFGEDLKREFVEDFVWPTYRHADADGFIKLFCLPARVGGDRDRASAGVRQRARELLDAASTAGL